MSLHYDEKGKFFTEYVSKEAIKAVIQTVTNRIEGFIYIRSGDRISDFLNKSEQFLKVTDATVFDLTGNQVYTCSFVAINLDTVIWIMPIDEKENESSQDKE
jgi:hypothetical protein